MHSNLRLTTRDCVYLVRLLLEIGAATYSKRSIYWQAAHGHWRSAGSTWPINLVNYVSDRSDFWFVITVHQEDCACRIKVSFKSVHTVNTHTAFDLPWAPAGFFFQGGHFSPKKLTTFLGLTLKTRVFSVTANAKTPCNISRGGQMTSKDGSNTGLH